MIYVYKNEKNNNINISFKCNFVEWNVKNIWQMKNNSLISFIILYEYNMFIKRMFSNANVLAFSYLSHKKIQQLKLHGKTDLINKLKLFQKIFIKMHREYYVTLV